MNAAIFETQQRANEMLREALAIWRQSVRSDLLEGIENDPVFSLLMSVIAYQANEFDNDIERIKTEILEEYAQSILPYGLQQAVPAGTVVAADLLDNVSDTEVNETTSFRLEGSDYRFMPLMNTRAVNLKVQSITLLDGRRWKVILKSPFILTDLSRFCFAIRDCIYQNLQITLKGQPLPLIRPWQYADWPLNRCFALDTMLYNKQRIFNAVSTVFDLYTRHNTSMYCVRPFNLKQFIPGETDTLEMVMEFTGIHNDFLFDASKLVLNAMVLVNANLHVATLSAHTPVYRVEGEAFMHLIHPQSEQLLGKSQVDVRRVAADRFNQANLVRLLQTIVNKYDTDYFAFRNIPTKNANRLIASLRELIKQLATQSDNEADHPSAGVYLMWHERSLTQAPDTSLNVEYLTTPGAAVNQALLPESTFQTANNFDNSTIRQIAIPVLGCNELGDDEALESTTRYYVTTQDRLVTPADLKMFCSHELLVHYGLSKEMVKSITVDTRPDRENLKVGYAVVVDITVEDSSFVQRTFAAKQALAEFRLQKMMEVRSANVYPIQVNIEILKNKE
jgi:hypothetical protein